MGFTEALRFLADRAGIKLTEFQPTYQDDERDQVLAVLNLAKEYYHYLLTDHRAGGNARQYLIERRVNQDSLKLFQLGYASATWDGLIKYLHQKKHYPVEALIKAGLVIRASGGRVYDRFRDRLMFPLKNHRGQVVGFAGRVLDSR